MRPVVVVVPGMIVVVDLAGMIVLIAVVLRKCCWSYWCWFCYYGCIFHLLVVSAVGDDGDADTVVVVVIGHLRC